MADTHMADTTVSRSLLKELVELRQVRLEKESLQQANVHYMTLVSHLELTISELKVQLQAKDSEISKWKSRAKKLTKKLESETSARHPLDLSREELSHKMQLLEEENAQLKSHAALKTEMERLRLQLEQSNKMQNVYREKYQETKVRLVTLATEHSESSESPEDTGGRKFPQRKQCRTAVSLSPRESWGEIRGPKEVPEVRKANPVFSTPSSCSSAIAFLIPEKPQTKASISSLKSSPMTPAVKPKSRTSALLSHKSSTSKQSRKSLEMRPPALSAYIPSFTRSKKTEKHPITHRLSPSRESPTNQPLETVTDESEFADYFPEENELA